MEIALDKCLLGSPFPFHSEWEVSVVVQPLLTSVHSRYMLGGRGCEGLCHLVMFLEEEGLYQPEDE